MQPLSPHHLLLQLFLSSGHDIYIFPNLCLLHPGKWLWEAKISEVSFHLVPSQLYPQNILCYSIMSLLPFSQDAHFYFSLIFLMILSIIIWGKGGIGDIHTCHQFTLKLIFPIKQNFRLGLIRNISPSECMHASQSTLIFFSQMLSLLTETTWRDTLYYPQCLRVF